MSTFQLNGKDFVSQTSSAEPVIASTVTFPAGHILNIQQGTIDDIVTTTSTTWADSGLTVNITPTSSSNKILVSFSSLCSCLAAGSYGGMLRLIRTISSTETNICVGATRGSRTPAISSAYSEASTYRGAHCNQQYLDSPSTTSSVNYKIQLRSGWTSRDFSMNTSGGDADADSRGTFMSTIQAMEVKG